MMGKWVQSWRVGQLGEALLGEVLVVVGAQEAVVKASQALLCGCSFRSWELGTREAGQLVRMVGSTQTRAARVLC